MGGLGDASPKFFLPAQKVGLNATMIDFRANQVETRRHSRQ